MRDGEKDGQIGDGDERVKRVVTPDSWMFSLKLLKRLLTKIVRK